MADDPEFGGEIVTITIAEEMIDIVVAMCWVGILRVVPEGGSRLGNVEVSECS